MIPTFGGTLINKMKFDYQARNNDGQVQKGIIEASSEEGALTILQKYGFYVTYLKETKAAPIYSKSIKIGGKVSDKDIVMFSRQLSIMFKSQVPIVEALNAISRQADKPELKEKIDKMSEEVAGGTTLSNAFSLYPRLFSPFFISMIKSGEASGKLSEALDFLANHLEKDYIFKSKLKGAMIYPILVSIVFIGVVVMMVFWILPPLMSILKESNQELPITTKMIVAFSDFFRKYWAAIAGFFAFIIFFLSRYIKTKQGKEFFDKNTIKMPVVGPLLKKIYLARFAENISTLISGGIHIATALEISADVVGNQVYRDIIMRTRDEVRKGATMSSVLAAYPKEISSLFVSMTVVGEKTGQIEFALSNIVSFYQKEADRSIDNLIGLLEPIMLIVMGVGVAILLSSILIPMYQIGNF
jgi:type IV pilus assembly protein PilC